MGLNKVMLIGNVGNDPEITYVQEDVPVAKFSLATSESYKDKNGEKVTNTEWHNIVIWRGLAKVVEQYVKKGAKLFIEGKISYQQYEKDGVTKYFTTVVARNMEMLGGKGEEGGGNYQKSPTTSTPSTQQQTNTTKTEETQAFEGGDMGELDDLPF